jgi:hypothetical protein
MGTVNRKWSGFVMAKKKSAFDYFREIRGAWTINPRTRVQENELKNTKKRRQNEKKMIKGEDFK